MPDFKFAQVNPNKLHAAWDAITPGLEHIKRHNPAAKWRLEDVYMSIRERRAELYAAYLDGEYGGFVILAEGPEAFTFQKTLLVWCVYEQRKFAHREIRDLCDKAIDDIARERGIKKLYFHSSRPAWKRFASKLGWREYETIYTKGVS